MGELARKKKKIWLKHTHTHIGYLGVYFLIFSYLKNVPSIDL